MIEYADPSLNPTRAVRAAQTARSFAGVIAWGFGSVLFLPVIGGLISLLFMQAYFGAIGAGIALVLLAVAGASAKRLRRRRGQIVLSYLLQAVELQLPLSEMLKAAAAGESRAIANRLDRLRFALEDGSAVGGALVLAVPQTPRRLVDLIDAGERNGSLAGALKRVVDERGMERGSLDLPAFFRAYALILIGVSAGVIAMIDVFIIPRYQQIIRDFHIPAANVVAMRFVVGFADVLAPLLAIVCGIATILAAGDAMRQLFSPALPRRAVFKSMLDRVLWPLPVAGSIVRDGGLADVLAVAGSALEAGRPLDDAMLEAAMPHLNVVLRQRVETWSQKIREGSSLPDAAAQAWMPPIVVGLLASATRSGNVPAAMSFLSRYYALRFSRTMLLIRGAAIPVLVLSAGVVVLMTALALFRPMIAMMQAAAIQSHMW